MADGQYAHLIYPAPVKAFLAANIGLPQLHIIAKALFSVSDDHLKDDGASDLEISAMEDLFGKLDDLLRVEIGEDWPTRESLA